MLTAGVGLVIVGGTAGYGFLKGMQRALFSNEAGQGSAPIAHAAAKTDEPVREGIVAGLGPFVDTLVICTLTGLVILLSGAWNRPPALVYAERPLLSPATAAGGQPVLTAGGERQWQASPVRLTVADRVEAEAQMREGAVVFLVVEAGRNAETGLGRRRVYGTLHGSDAVGWTAQFDAFSLPVGTAPAIAVDGVYFDFKGAIMTAKAFDRVLPGRGGWVVPLAVWLFAFSTMISWSYYGEQGIVYLFGSRAIMAYRVAYCLFIILSVQLVRTQDQLDLYSSFGTGVMLWANIPIVLLFGPRAMRAYHD